MFVHGFAVDEKNSKMSKSLGNVVDPEEITKGGKDMNKKPVYGVDVLRYKLIGFFGLKNILIRYSLHYLFNLTMYIFYNTDGGLLVMELNTHMCQ